MTKLLTDSDLKTNFADEFSKNFLIDLENSKIIISNVKINSTDVNKSLIQKILTLLEVKNFDTIEIKDSQFNFQQLSFPTRKVVFKNCIIEGEANFGLGKPSIVELQHIKVPKLRINVFGGSLTLSNSEIERVNVSSVNGVTVNILDITGKTIIHELVGLSALLPADVNTIVQFSPLAKITANAQLTYRVLRRVAQKSNDTTQSQILHSKILELYSRNADTDSKVLLLFEKITNNYGQSFILPILWMFVINTIFLVCYLKFNIIEVNFFSDYIFSVLNVNPLYSFVFIDNSEVSWQLALDSIRKFVLAALAYQTLVAARRFSFKQ